MWNLICTACYVEAKAEMLQPKYTSKTIPGQKLREEIAVTIHPKKLLDHVREAIRLKHHSTRMEEDSRHNLAASQIGEPSV